MAAMGNHDFVMENALALVQQPVSTLAVPESIVQADLARLQTVQTFALSRQQDGVRQYSEADMVALLRGKVAEMEAEARYWQEGVQRELAHASHRSKLQIEEAQQFGQQAFDREAYVAKEAEMQASSNARVAIDAEQKTGHLQTMLEIADPKSQQAAERISRSW